MNYDIDSLWEMISDADVDKMQESICNTCKNKCEPACEECDWTVGEVIHRSHYWNPSDEV